MKKKNENAEQMIFNHKSVNHFFNNSILNQLNLEEIKNNPHNILKVLTPQKKLQKEVKINNNFEKGINEYINSGNKERFCCKNNKLRYMQNIISFNNIKKKNNFNILYKNFLLGNDVILPLKSINEIENSNIPYYIFNNSKKLSPIKKNSRVNSNYLTEKKNYEKNNNYNNSSKQAKAKRIKKSKDFLFKSKKLANNKDLNLYNTIELDNSHKNYFNNIYFKTHYNYRNNKNHFTQLENSSPIIKNIKKINPSFPIKRLKSNKLNRKIYNYLNDNKNNYKREKYNNEIEKMQETIVYDKIKNLIEEPNNLIYLMFNKMKKSNFKEMQPSKRYDLKKKIIEYKKDLNKIEQRARLELFNLQKQIVIGNEVNIKGKIISTNTFFNLAFRDY